MITSAVANDFSIKEINQDADVVLLMIAPYINQIAYNNNNKLHSLKKGAIKFVN